MVTFETVMEIKILHKQGMSSRAMSRRAPQEGRSYEQALYSVVLLVPRLPRPERTGTVRVLLDFIADLWELDRSRVDADFASLVRGLPR